MDAPLLSSPPAQMKVVEVVLVAPSPEITDSAASPTSLPLTFFDILWLRFAPVERLFFYDFPNPPSSFFQSLLPKLKHSLSLTLAHFLPLAGNIIWNPHSPEPFIRYLPGQDAVSLTVVESHSDDFNLLSSSRFSDARRSRLLVPRLTVSHDKASLMSIQITLFPCFGFSIGITTHHATMDGKYSTLFTKAWAYLCSNLAHPSSSSLVSSLPQNLNPSFDRSVIIDPCGRISETSSFYLKQGGPNNRSLMLWGNKRDDKEKLVRGTFELLPSDIQKLKKSAEMKNKKLHLSTFSVTCAYIISCLVKAEEAKQDKVLFPFSVDCRPRLDPAIPSAYFGNCVGGAVAMAEAESMLGDDGFIVAVEAISESLKRLEEQEILSVAETWISYMETFGVDDTYMIFTTAGSPRFEVYKSDFGWGRPKKVEIVSIDHTGAFSLSESRDGNGGGIEIGLVLNKSKMEAFSSLFVRGLLPDITSSCQKHWWY